MLCALGHCSYCRVEILTVIYSSVVLLNMEKHGCIPGKSLQHKQSTRKRKRIDSVESCAESDVAVSDVDHREDTVNPESSNLCFPDLQFPSVGSRSTRKVYLITYSKASDSYCKESFSSIVVDAFHNTGDAIVQKWVCSKEKHTVEGFHFHMTVKLSKQRRWLAVKHKVQADHADIRLHFSERPQNSKNENAYDGAYHYTIKGGDFICSDGHPSVTSPPVVTPKMKNLDFLQMVVSKSLKSQLEVRAVAKINATAGNTALMSFLAAKGEKKVGELLKLAWDIEDAPNKLQRLGCDRLTLLQNALQCTCSCPSIGLWQSMAYDVLSRNNIPLDTYTQAVLAAITLGRGKFRNILHVGETNRAKSFLIQPLKKIFHAFENPAHGAFSWAGVDESEIILLNDFRWCHAVIPWEQFLLLLEGDTVKFPVKFQDDITLKKHLPIFATSKSPITFGKNAEEHTKENKMMDSRWKVFNFHYKYSENKQISCDPCMRCYADFLYCLDGNE